MFITRAIELGVDVKVIAEWQGHRDGGKLILDTYSHVNRVHSQRMAQLMTTAEPENLVRMPWSQHGFDTYSMSIVASDKTMGERPKVLRDFLAASYTGWRDVMADPKAALEIFKKRVPDIDLALIEPNMMLGLELMRTERYARNGIGWMDRGKMCGTVEFINTYMPDMPRKVGCDEVFTNEFLTKIEPPKR